MPIPLVIAAPAAVATIGYLSARTQFVHDYSLLKTLAKKNVNGVLLQRKDRLNYFYFVEDHAKSKNTANHTFLVYEGVEWTYEETYDTVLKYAEWLKTKYRVAPGEVVALDFMNSPKFVFIWFALWSLGAHPAFINYNLTSKPLLHCIKTSGARITFVDDEIKHQFSEEVLEALRSTGFREGKGSVEVVYLDNQLERVIEISMSGLREPDTSRSGAVLPSLAILIYTSGTTGNPKPAIVSWDKILSTSCVMQNWMGWKRKDRFYSCMPLYHSTAAILGILPALYIGSTFSMGHKFSNRTFWPEVRASRATVIQYVGETCRYLLSAPPQLDPITGENLDKKHKVRIAFGNGLRPDVWQRFKDRFGIETIAEFYSATEAVSASWNYSTNSFARGAVGKFGTLIRLLMGKKMAIVELDWESETPLRDPKRGNLCTPVKSGTQGELLYALDAAAIEKTFQGYYKNEKANNSKIMRDVLQKGDAWFRTGDVVRMDEEGRMWFVDRIGDTFRWKSENVSTTEIQEVLGIHPVVKDVNVYGVELPNHDGRAGCVAMVLDKDVDNHLLDSLASHANQKLPKHAVPLFLRVTKEIEVTGNNKQQKHVLRAQGVEPGKVSVEDRVYWLKNGTYVEFSESDWEGLKAATVKL